MWGENIENCDETDCQCSGLITDNFTIHSGNSATKRKQETALSYNYKAQMNPHTLDFSSPIQSPIQKRRILGELQNFKPSSPVIERLKSPLDVKSPLKKTPYNLNMVQSPMSVQSPLHKLHNVQSPLNKLHNVQSPLNKLHNVQSPLNKLHNVQSPLNKLHNVQSPLNKLHNVQSPLNKLHKIQSPLHANSPLSMKSPLTSLNSPIIASHSPLTSRLKQRTKISRIAEERSRFKSSHSNKENMGNQSLNSMECETYMNLGLEEETRDCSFGSQFEGRRRAERSMAKLDFTDAISSKSYSEEEILVPEKEQDLDDLESLQDLEAEFDNDNFEQCNYEIISTDSPDIISQGRRSSRKISARNFNFGAPISDNEQSTSFNLPTTRMLNFDDDNFEFTSPAVKKPVSVKKSLKFDGTPTKTFLRRDRSDSSIGSMSLSPSSSVSRLPRVFTSESTTSMESGFISEFEEPFLDIEESNSPKIANFNDLLSGQIKDNPITENNFLKRPTLGRSLSLHPESKARCALLSILESPEKRKRTERQEEVEKNSKRRRSNCESPAERRPVLQRAFSENNASIMSALARSSVEPDLIGDFSQPFSLPLTRGDHSDLKSISCDTLAGLLRGEYQDTVPEYQVIDCRYPYEFEGGHIDGAVNLYTGAQVADELGRGKRRVLVFHCEFSLQRGPTLSRYLRSADREKNKENYPNLDYPEVYLLHEGYRAFYQRYPELCTPMGYTAMLDPKHKHLLRKHRSIAEPSKTVRRNRLLL